MPDAPWKRFERLVAGIFGSVRNSLSGGNSKVTRSDSLHESLFISCKHTKSGHKSLRDLLFEESEKADAEGKIPVCVVGINGRGKNAIDNTFVAIPLKYLRRFHETPIAWGDTLEGNDNDQESNA